MDRQSKYIAASGVLVGLTALVLGNDSSNGEFGFLSGCMDRMFMIPNWVMSQCNELGLSGARDGDGVVSRPNNFGYYLGFNTVGAFYEAMFYGAIFGGPKLLFGKDKTE